MSLRVAFDLEETDLEYFRSIMKRAGASAQRASEEEVVTHADAMINNVKAANLPVFVAQRIDRVESLIDMLRDGEWQLAGGERNNVVTALAYFVEPKDVIPDDVPVLGYIDDAIMIELIMRELKHEIEAFDDFRRYQREEASRNRNPSVTREDWLAAKRRELHQRMRRRRNFRGPRESGRTRVRLF